MKIITGHTGINHVESDDDRALHGGTFGAGSYVLNSGTRLRATIESSNTIRLDCGDIIHQGTHARIAYGEYEDVTIDNGTTGYMRKDLIVARYNKVAGLETMELVTIKGVPAVSNPVTPEYTQGDILEADSISDMPLYEVLLNGVNIESITTLFTILNKTLADMQKDVYSTAQIDEKLTQVQNRINTAQDAANAAASLANTAQIAANDAMGMAKKGLVLVASTIRTVTLNPGNSGVVVSTNINITLEIPAGTEYVAVITNGITNGASVKNVSASVAGTTCTITGIAESTAATSGTARLELLCFARPEHI